MTIKLSECCEKPLIDNSRVRNSRVQRQHAVSPATVWAWCSCCGDKTLVLASKRWDLAAPWDVESEPIDPDLLVAVDREKR